MSSWKGSFITGPKGSARLKALALKLDEQVLERTNAVVEGEFTQYQPWMSNAQMRTSWSSLGSYSSRIITDKDYLKALSGFFEEDSFPMRAIHPENRSQAIEFSDSERISQFHDNMDQYIEMLTSLGLDYQERLDALVRQLIPLTVASPELSQRFDGEGLSTLLFRGGIFLNLAKESDRQHTENLLNLVHELGHQALDTYLLCDQIIVGDPETPSYSVVRKTFRPGILSIHALAATAYMVELMLRGWRLLSQLSGHDQIKKRYAELLSDLSLGIGQAKALPLTPTGREIMSEFETLFNAAQIEYEQQLV